MRYQSISVIIASKSGVILNFGPSAEPQKWVPFLTMENWKIEFMTLALYIETTNNC